MSKASLTHRDLQDYKFNTPAIKIEQPLPDREHRSIFMFSLSTKMVYDLMKNELLKSDEFIFDEDEGYQRPHSNRRSAAFANFIRGESAASLEHTSAAGWCPSAVTLFLRDKEAFKFKNGALVLNLGKNNSCLYIPDGQHRLYGMAHAYMKELKQLEESRAASSPIAKYELPVVLVCATSDDGQLEEAQFFHTINTTAKRVSTNLANQFILKRLEDKEGEIALDKPIPRTGTHKEFKPYVLKLVISLNNDGVWKSKILMAGQYNSKEEAKMRRYMPINQVSFVSSLQSFVRDECSKAKWSINEMNQVVNAYWTAISRKCPKAISYWRSNVDNNKEYYHLRTTMGVYTLNALLAQIVTRREIDKDADNWEKVLSSADEYFSDEFWLAGNPNGCGKYGTSMGSFNNLMNDILNNL